MIVPDVNLLIYLCLLIYAYDSGSRFHDQARLWWERCLSGGETVGLSWIVLLGFLRIRCSARVFRNPLPVAEAADHVQSWLERPQVQILHPGVSQNAAHGGALDLQPGGNGPSRPCCRLCRIVPAPDRLSAPPSGAVPTACSHAARTVNRTPTFFCRARTMAKKFAALGLPLGPSMR